MKFEKTIKIVTNKWFIQTIGLLIVACIIWFVGPIVAISDAYFLETISSRLLVILLVMFVWGGYQYTKYYLAHKNDRKFAENLTLHNAKKDEENAIQDRFNDAISTLKMAGSKKDSILLNSLPWYIIIGPPGSGKTTALMNSGLEFPLKDKLGADAVRGIAGTRHCDWWFTNEAVLIDTAGRFTTQDSDSEVDKTAWHSFMGMLKKHRTQRPINGTIITMSLSDMLTLSEDELTFYAKTIRRRIDELSEHLGVKYPIYFMFTKCDLVNGFTPFFNSLSAKQRNQVWGETFGLTEDGDCAIDINNYDLHFDELLNRLNSQVLLYLRQQNDPAKKADILSFPAQMESMKEAIHKFLNDIFGENSFQQPALLRGVYFTSGTQQGSPFDSLLGSIANDMGITLDENVNFSGRGKSFFISDLLSKVIFPESNIAGVNQKRQKWIKRLQFASVISALFISISFVGIWYLSYTQNVDRIKTVEKNADNQQSIVLSRADDVSSFESILVELDEARSALSIFEPKTFSDNFGLNQKESFDSQNNAVYLSVLETRLLPLITHRIEEIMMSILRQGDKADLYSFLKAYLMYAGQHTSTDTPFQVEWLKALSLVDWQNSFADKPEMTESLNRHLDHLLTQSFAYIQPNEALVSAARNALLQLPLEHQVYASIRDTMLNSSEHDLLFSQIAGPEGLTAFTGKGKRSLEEFYIPGMFTKSGFLGSFLIRASEISDEYLANTWILGEQNKQVNIPSKAELQGKIYNLYYREYIDTWSNLLRSISVSGVNDLQQGLFTLRAFGNTNGPIDTLIRNIAEQTNLAGIAKSANAVKGAGEVASVVSSQAQRIISQANRLGRATQKSGLLSIPGQPVTTHFKAFHRLVSAQSGDAKLLQLNSNILQYVDFIQQTLNDNFSETPAFNVAVGRLRNTNRSEFGRLKTNSSANPDEVNTLLNQLSQVGWELVMLQARTEVQEIWKKQVFSIYEMALLDRYPFDVNASTETELVDFANFFASQGVLDSFLERYIKPFIDTQSSVWRTKSFGGVTLGLNAKSLQQLQQGNQITKFFFSTNSALPSLKFSLLPVSLDVNAAKFSMTMGTQNIEYAHGPRRYTNLSWPFSTTNELIKLEFIQLDGTLLSLSEIGPWSLFRLLDKNLVEPTTRNSTYNTTFSINDLSITYELRASSEFNPIGARVLQNFTLPEGL